MFQGMKDPSWMQSQGSVLFIGYGTDEFGYRFYDPIKKKLVRSCDMKFMV